MPRLRKPDSELTPKQLDRRRYMDAWRARMTPEEKEEYRAKSKAAYRSMAPERKAALIRDQVLRAKERIKNFTPERLAKHRKAIVEYKRKWRKNLAPEQHEVRKKRAAKYRRDRYSKLSPEEKRKWLRHKSAGKIANLPPSVLGHTYPLLGAEFFRQHPDIAEQFRKKIRLGRKIKQLSKNEQNP